MSGRQFAKILGCSEGNVRKLLARGKISEKSLDRSDPSCVKIFVERAKIEVAENQTHVHNADPVKKAKTRHNRAERILPPPKATPVKPPEPSINNLPQGPEKPLTEMTLNELDKIGKIRDIRMKEIKIEQELKILVPIAAVDEALFEGGQQVREALENMPSRVVDQLLGLTDRDEMLNIMEVEIFEILTKLADIGDKLPR